MEKGGNLVKKILKISIILFVAIVYITFVIALSFGSLTAGVFTVLPAEFFGWEVSKASPLGYYSVCSFAPYSTLILFGMSAVGFLLLVKLVKYLRRKTQNSKLYLRYKMPTQKV